MDNQDKRLFLLDAFALIYRAYFAFIKNPRINSKGMNTSAVFGFTNTLNDLLKREKPTHIAVVFDTSEPTVRHIEYPAYKAQREEMPEDLRKSIPYIKQLIEAYKIPILFAHGYEADDVIGTLAKKAEKVGYQTFMMTPDKDYGQLVSKNIFMYKPASHGNGVEILGVKEICAKFEIKAPEQVIDILGLMGDKVDNIPGIPGVGEKTAIQLIKDYGSVENLVQNTSGLKGKLKEKVENNIEQALLSKKLATIILDVPIEFEEDKLIMEEPDQDALRELFAELEFRRAASIVLGEDLFGGENTDSKTSTPTKIAVEEDAEEKVFQEIKTIQDTEHTYHFLNDAAGRKSLHAILSKSKEICFDTETTGLDANNVEIVGLSFSIKPFEAYYIPLPDNYNEAHKIIAEFKDIFENEKTLKIGQNIKYDMNVLKWYDIEVKGPLFDTMVAHFLIQPDMRHNMNVLAETYLHYSPVSIETLIGKRGKGQLSMREVDEAIISDYAAEDADVTIRLKEVFLPMLDETNTLKLFNEVETPLIPVLASMEAEGIRLDKSALKELSLELEKDVAKIILEIYDLAGMEFNIASPKQVGEVLFEKLNIVDKPKKTKTGQYATGEEILSKLEDKHVIVKKILEYREIQKLKNTYVDTLPTLVNPRTGRLHTSYNQVVAVTGRLSSDNPNLQNIPVRTERGREIRKAFVPRNEEFVLLAADYSQIELRIIADLSGDEGMQEAFSKGHDIHAATAAKVYGVDLKDVNSDMRRNAKMVNFGIIYGISAFGLSERLNIPRREAADIIEQYFIKYPGVKSYMDESVAKAKEMGYVETILGRRRYLRDINSGNAVVRGFAERNAINAPIQGSAADMIKIAMISIHNEMQKKNMKSKMLLQVHDELVFDAHRSELDELKILVEDKMKNAIPLKVPVEVGIGTGDNWLQAH